MRTILCMLAVLVAGPGRTGAAAQTPERLDLRKSTIVVRSGTRPPGERVAPQVLQEEIQYRTGLLWPIRDEWLEEGVRIVILSGTNAAPGGHTLPRRMGPNPEERPEGFRIAVDPSREGGATVWVQGADGRGALYGVGQLLRSLVWSKDEAFLPLPMDLASAPQEPIRGHQLGYRHTANSYDGWTGQQYDRYIRELALFGANSVENIPFQDERPSPVMLTDRRTMNLKLSEICGKYDLDYWIWSPATFDLNDQAKRAAWLRDHEALFRECPRLNGVFFPGGDPGDNPPDLVLPLLQDLSKSLAAVHPRAKIWLSMQGFTPTQVDAVHAWIARQRPGWLGGLVAGPSSPPIPETRRRLPAEYGLRDYPDLTHTVRCQYPVPWWDPAFALTLGREPVNPRPVFYKAVHDYFGPFTSGFISYSDGIHDDVNKAVWTRLGWDPDAQPRDILLEYTRCFFGGAVAETAADAILALEKNWAGPLSENGAVDATLNLWQSLEARAPGLSQNWRWQLCLLRAYYDAYTRHRLLFESALEAEANQALARTKVDGSNAAMAAAETILNRARPGAIRPEWHARVKQLCADLFDSIKFQTSVPFYHASGAERGAVLDFLDYPLNNRWWLEDEFRRIRRLPEEVDRQKAIKLIAHWEHPGPGSFYDEVGNIAKSPHVVRGEGINTDPTMERNPNPTSWWWDDGMSRRRLSWQTSLDWPLAVVYQHLDPKGSYLVRLTGYGQALLRGNGQLLTPALNSREIGAFKEFAVPSELIASGKLRLTFDPPKDEGHLNWRQQSRVSEVWLLKQ